MKGFLKKLVTKVAKGQGGFTLIEMIVVVGIIAVLAAVIVPNIGKFIGSGEQGAKDAEWESVQTAMNAMMAEKAVTTVSFIATGNPSNQNWLAQPAACTATMAETCLKDYLQSQTTVYFYCWSNTGQLTDQYETNTNC